MKVVERLKKRGEFRKVYENGRSLANRVCVVYILKRPGEPSRVGLAVGKKIGKATVRNRIKRVFRESVRSLLGRVRPGYWIILIARGGAKGLGVREATPAIQEVMKRAGLLQSSREVAADGGEAPDGTR